MAAVYAFPYVHSAFSRLGHPMLAIPVGGLVLGLLGALGGHLTLFKGLDEVKVLAAEPGGLVGRTVRADGRGETGRTPGRRGLRLPGRPDLPRRLRRGSPRTVRARAGTRRSIPRSVWSCGVLGVLLAVTRQGWISLFTAAILVVRPGRAALLCSASVPAWLLVTGRPQMQLHDDGTPIR